MCLGIKVNKDKIGNLMVYLSERISPIYHTQLIKLLYLIDEEAVKDDGVPVTWLDYKAWQYGPVAPDTYYIKCGGMEFSDYVKAEKCSGSDNHFYVLPKVSFSDDKFSDYEMDIIDRVIKEYGNKKPSELVNLTHKKGSLWDITKKEHNIIFDNDYKVSDYSVDFKRVIADDPEKLENYNGAMEIMMINSKLKSCDNV
jgi:uncharacterized phage-associated protein